MRFAPTLNSLSVCNHALRTSEVAGKFYAGK